MADDSLSKEIFIVHGRNDEVKNKVSEFLTNFRLNPIILNEQANEGMTVIEKFERHANVGFAVVLMTDDDLGKERSSPNLNARARQNVILELGYFIAKKRSRVCILYSKGVELPTDLGGIVYIEIDTGEEWKKSLEKELRKAGYDNVFAVMSVDNKNLMLNRQLWPVKNCRISVINQFNEGETILIEGIFADDYLDIKFDSHGEKISSVEYTFVNFKEFLFYVHVSCFDTNTRINGWRWISLKNEIFTLSTAVGELEKAFPVKATALGKDWKKISVNVEKVFNKLFGGEGLQYLNLDQMRIRGSGKLLNIILR
jgi:hypothetical protein